MTATAIVGSDSVCGATLKPYTECPGNHQHAFSDPEREGRLHAGWATIHEPVPEMVARINAWWLAME